MASTTSDQMVLRLYDWGVRRIYGYPGDAINGLMGALNRLGDRMEFVQARHEELAAFMATAHAKFTGQVGVCMATSGPGAIHLLNGLYDAKADHQPVLAIVGQAARSAMGGDYQQEAPRARSSVGLDVGPAPRRARALRPGRRSAARGRGAIRARGPALPSTSAWIGVVPRRQPDLPDALVGLAPDPEGGVGELGPARAQPRRASLSRRAAARAVRAPRRAPVSARPPPAGTAASPAARPSG